jgi:hypothetical protein
LGDRPKSLSLFFYLNFDRNRHVIFIESLDILRKAGAKIIAEHSSNPQVNALPAEHPQLTKSPDFLRPDYAKPWAIVRVLPDARNHTVARFCNRQDAEDRLRALRRFVRSGIFEIMFDRPHDLELD